MSPRIALRLLAVSAVVLGHTLGLQTHTPAQVAISGSHAGTRSAIEANVSFLTTGHVQWNTEWWESDAQSNRPKNIVLCEFIEVGPEQVARVIASHTQRAGESISSVAIDVQPVQLDADSPYLEWLSPGPGLNCESVIVLSAAIRAELSNVPVSIRVTNRAEGKFRIGKD